MSTPHTATSTSLQSAGVMMLFALVFTAAMALTYQLTKPSILAAEEAQKMRLLDAVLPADRYDNDLLEDYVELGRTAALGLDSGGRVFRARKGGAPAALVVEAIAPDGYGGRIGLLVAIGVDRRVAGVRVTSHRETPGLGDYIDPRRDRNKKAPWIEQFRGQARSGTRPLRLTKDGGRIAYRVGATISARAVTAAVARVLEWTRSREQKLYSADTGATL